MELKDAITGISLLVVVVGWLFGRWKDRNHEVFKERLKRRLEMYNSVMAAARECICSVKQNGIHNNSGPRVNGASLLGAKLITFSYAVDVGDDALNEKLRAAHTAMNLYGTRDEVLRLAQFTHAIQSGDTERMTKSLNELLVMLIKKTRKELGYQSSNSLRTPPLDLTN